MSSGFRIPRLAFGAALFVAIANLSSPQVVHARTLTALCARLLNLATHSQSQIDVNNIDLNSRLPGWTTGDNSKTDSIRNAYQRAISSHLSQNGPSAVSPNQLFIGYLNEHGYNVNQGDFAEHGKAFQKTDATNDKKIRQIIRNTPIEKIIADRATKTGDLGESDIESAIDRIQSRQLVGEKDLLALDELRKKIKVFEGTTAFLQNKGAFEGKVDLIIAEYLTRNDAFFRAQIDALAPGTSLIISIPKVTNDAAGTPTLTTEVLSFTDIDTYDSFSDARLNRRKEVNNINRLQKKYLDDYIFARSMARRLQSIKTNDVVFSTDVHFSDEETANKTQYERHVGAIRSVLNFNTPIHPSVAALENHVRKDSRRRIFTKGKVITTALFLGTLAAWDIWGKTKSVFYDPAEDYRDNMNVFVESYWIEKCSSEETISSIEECLEKFRSLLTKALKEETKANLAKDPGHSDLVEKKKFDDIYISVMNAIYDKVPMEIYTEVNGGQATDYARQRIYKAGTKATQAQLEKQPSAANADLKEQKAQLATQAKIDTITEMQAQYSEVTKEFNDFSVKHELNRSAVGDNPKIAAELDLRHLLFLKNIMTRLLYLQESKVDNETDPKLAQLKSKIGEQINNIGDEIEATMDLVLAKVPTGDTKELPTGLATDKE